jgi:hypothetical protein
LGARSRASAGPLRRAAVSVPALPQPLPRRRGPGPTRGAGGDLDAGVANPGGARPTAAPRPAARGRGRTLDRLPAAPGRPAARYPSNRRGVGGRRPRAFPGHGPEAAVRELGRLCRRLHDFHDQAWAPLKKGEWWGLVSQWPRTEREKLRQLLTGADVKARQAAAACKHAADRHIRYGLPESRLRRLLWPGCQRQRGRHLPDWHGRCRRQAVRL